MMRIQSTVMASAATSAATAALLTANKNSGFETDGQFPPANGPWPAVAWPLEGGGRAAVPPCRGGRGCIIRFIKTAALARRAAAVAAAAIAVVVVVVVVAAAEVRGLVIPLEESPSDTQSGLLLVRTERKCSILTRWSRRTRCTALCRTGEKSATGERASSFAWAGPKAEQRSGTSPVHGSRTNRFRVNNVCGESRGGVAWRAAL